MENTPKITIEELAVKLNGKMWVKGDLKRIYLDRGYNTKKMSTKTYVEETATGDFNVRCFVECPSQDYNWCKSQANQVIEGVEEDIEEIIKLSKVQLLEARLSANENEIEVRISFNGVEETDFLTEEQFDERFNKYPQSVFDSLPETKIIERVVEHIVKNEVPIETPKSIKYPIIIKTVDEFNLMSSSEVCKLLNSDTSLAITGDKKGVDRHIIKRYS